jgi:hypothetical protein
MSGRTFSPRNEHLDLGRFPLAGLNRSTKTTLVRLALLK